MVEKLEKEADFKTKDGKEYNFDLYALTYDEYLAFFDTKQTEDEAKEVIARVCHVKKEEIGKLAYADWRLLTKAFFDKARKPIEDPN